MQRPATSAGIGALAQCRGLMDIDLFACVEVEDRCLIRLAERNPMLCAVSVGKCKHVTGSFMIALARRCPNLRTLDFSGTRNATVDQMRELVNGCPRLEMLNVRHCIPVGALGDFNDWVHDVRKQQAAAAALTRGAAAPGVPEVPFRLVPRCT